MHHQSQNSSAKVAIVLQDQALFAFESKLKKSLNWSVLPNVVFGVIHVGFGICANNFFYQILDKTVQQLTETGVLQLMLSNSFGPKFIKKFHKSPNVLSFNDLSFGFVICLVTLGISFLVFLGEYASSKRYFKKGLKLFKKA